MSDPFSQATAIKSPQQHVKIPIHDASILEGMIGLPATTPARGLVIFAHGSGSSRNSPRNNAVAGALQHAGLATLLFDLLTEAEDRDYAKRFDIPLLAERLQIATQWARHQPDMKQLNVGYFGASTGAAAALMAAAQQPRIIAAVVSRGGRPDLVESFLAKVRAPTLLIVGGHDQVVLHLNQDAAKHLIMATHDVVVIPHSTHLFEEPGSLEQVAQHAIKWFLRYLPSPRAAQPAHAAERQSHESQ